MFSTFDGGRIGGLELRFAGITREGYSLASASISPSPTAVSVQKGRKVGAGLFFKHNADNRWEEGRVAYIAEQAAADRKAEIERKGDDAKLRGMSDYDLCVDGLRSRRLPVEPCDVLRWVRP